MMFNQILSIALAQAITASAATMMVTVGANNQFTFSPQSITAQPGDMVAFNFVTQNHSVASSTANRPCQPEKNAIFSDFQPVAAVASTNNNNNNKGGRKGKNNNKRQQAAPNTPMFMVPITDSNPMYIYCSQAQHCQQGMVMVINPPNDAAVQQYANKAAKAKNNVSPKGGVSGGSVQNNAAGTNPKVVAGSQMPAGPNGQITAQIGGKNGNGNGKGKGKGLLGLLGN
ncbi:unnamed protein product [Periconia digitata]|uniref:Extracellular serine-rich protein n=1 Tax=Periconia digitata TaxID=1303443 RepID=A0A9W4U571_9PLEO|nr:unnamed protein product [Periconia digitata]